MPVCVATGHAAGVCAAIAARSGSTPQAVDYRAVQSELTRQGPDIRGVV